MIVKCERCQTRFKIPDEKVTEKGVKVRCTKCQNTFRVARDATAAAPTGPSGSSADGQVDPFAHFGVAPDPRTVEVTKPGYFALGVEASKPLSPQARAPAPNWNSVDGDLGAEDSVFREPTRITPLPVPAAALSPLASGGGSPPGAFVVPGRESPGRPPAKSGALGAAVPPGREDRSAPPVPDAAGPAVSPASARRSPVPPGAGPAPDPFSDLLGAPAPAGPSASAANALRRSAVQPPLGGAPTGAVALGVMRPATAPPTAPPAYGGDDPFASIDIDVAPVPAMASEGVPSGDSDPFAAITMDVAPVPSPQPGRPPAEGGDPFAAIDIHGAPPARPAPGGSLRGDADPFSSIDIHGAPPARPAPGGSLRGNADPFAAIDIHGAPQARPAPGGSLRGDADPFASIDIQGAPPVRPAPGESPQGEADPFASIDIHAAAPSHGAPPSMPPDPFASIGVGASSHPGSAQGAGAGAGAEHFGLPNTAEGLGPAHGTARTGSSTTEGLAAPVNAGDLFDLGSDTGASEGDLGLEPTDTGRAALFGTMESSSEGLTAFEGGSLLADVPPVDDAEAFGVTLGRVGAGSGVQREVLDMDGLPAKPVVTVARPTARPEDVGIPQSRPLSRGRKLVAFTINIVLATVLVAVLGMLGRVYLREGRVDASALSLESLRALLMPAPKPLVAVEVTQGLYETRDGRALFYVRGDAVNHSDAASRIRVRAALFDGGQRVASSEALVGSIPTPEELYDVSTSESASALRQRVDAAAVSVAPGAKAPFVVLFHEHPADPGSFRLELTLEPELPKPPETGRGTE